MAGFGDLFLAHLKTVPQANTEDLAKLAGVTVEQAYSRLMALSYEKRMVSAGKGKHRSWALPGGKMPEPITVEKTAASVSQKLTERHQYGWKPNLSRFETLVGPVKPGDKLLVEYPEDWRHTMFCTVTEPSGAFGQQNIARVWNLRDDCFSVVDVVDFSSHGHKVVRVVNNKDIARFADES